MQELNPLLHSQLRLAVMSILMNVEEADFVYLKEKTESTAGNLSVQLDKLASAGYINIEKICRENARAQYARSVTSAATLLSNMSKCLKAISISETESRRPCGCD